MKPPSTRPVAASQASTTGSCRRNRWTTATVSRPARVEALVASRIGRNTSVGSGAPCCSRYMKMVTGSTVNEEALSTRNRICALLAVSGRGLSVCSSRMARRPIGVAALSRPMPLAAKLSVIRPIAGCPAGTSGIRRRNSGPSRRARASTRPARSAMRKKPSHRVRVPNSSTMISTDNPAMSNRAPTMAWKTSASPPSSQRPKAASAAIRKKASHRPLSMPKGSWVIVPGREHGTRRHRAGRLAATGAGRFGDRAVSRPRPKARPRPRPGPGRP